MAHRLHIYFQNNLHKQNMKYQKVKLKIEADFKNQTDTIRFSYEEGEEFKQIGPDHKTAFDLEYFTGCRYALFNWGSKETDGSARFSQFDYNE